MIYGTHTALKDGVVSALKLNDSYVLTKEIQTILAIMDNCHDSWPSRVNTNQHLCGSGERNGTKGG